MRDMADKITNSDTIIPYLVASNTVNGGVFMTMLHSTLNNIVGCRGGGGSNALHGMTLL
jgi:hypothetical protein